MDSMSSIPGLPLMRHLRGLSQTDLARLLGLSRGTIGRYEAGLRHVNVPRLNQLADALGCTPSDLLTPPSYSDNHENGTVGK